jgi:hypothetical protein
MILSTAGKEKSAAIVAEMAALQEVGELKETIEDTDAETVRGQSMAWLIGDAGGFRPYLVFVVAADPPPHAEAIVDSSSRGESKIGPATDTERVLDLPQANKNFAIWLDPAVWTEIDLRANQIILFGLSMKVAVGEKARLSCDTNARSVVEIDKPSDALEASIASEISAEV